MTELNRAYDQDGPNPWEPEIPPEKMDAALARAGRMFSAWLSELDGAQLAALMANWENVLDDAALDRVDSWVIAGRAITELRGRPKGDNRNGRT